VTTAGGRSAARGYARAATAAALWALHGSLAIFLIDDGVDSPRLSEMRSAGSFLILLAALAIVNRPLLRVDRRDVKMLAVLGIPGLALVHFAYYEGVDHLGVGPALTIQYLAPGLLLMWLWLAHGRRLRPSLWGALALSVTGCFFVVRAYDYEALDVAGVAFALVSALAFAIYVVSSERAGQRYLPATTLLWGFGFATLFWSFAQPWWTFPWDRFDTTSNVALALGVILIGTLIPFLLMVTALRHIPAPRAAIVATLEPALGALFEWVIHGTALAAIQIAGGVAVLAAVVWVQTQRPDLQQEGAPALREAR
jgi:drug/metabolite transporter (DMT)-like permease